MKTGPEGPVELLLLEHDAQGQVLVTSRLRSTFTVADCPLAASTTVTGTVVSVATHAEAPVRRVTAKLVAVKVPVGIEINDKAEAGIVA